MRNSFEILKLNNEPYDFLVIATSYENPLSSFKEIEDVIQVHRANLLFDLTLINGVNKNRYIKCEYEAGKNQLQSCVMLKALMMRLKKSVTIISWKMKM